MAYRVTFNVEPQLHDRDRLTVFLRIILAVPHLVLVGGHGYREIAPVSGKNLLRRTGDKHAHIHYPYGGGVG
jgi:hypothetical protein